jgi:hypothetical protein
MPDVSAYSITAPRTSVTVERVARTGQFTVDVKNDQSAPDRVVVTIEGGTAEVVPPGVVAPGEPALGGGSPGEPAPSGTAPGNGESAGAAPPVVATGATAADPAWFAVDRHLRPIPAGGSEQFLVTVTVPATVSPGAYSLRPAAYSADHPPDVTKVDGPLMTVVVPETQKRQPWWRRWWPWWLVAIGVAVLLAVAIAVVVIVLSGGGKVAVPNEVNRSLADAQSDLSAHNLTAGTVTRLVNTGVAKDTVLTQSPAAGTQVDKNSAVALTVADNVTVPNLVGQQLNTARSILQGNELVPQPTGPITSPRAGLCGFLFQQHSCVVFTQNPAPGQRVDPGSPVTLGVS